MNKVKFSELKSKLVSLGFGFYSDASEIPADPERTIIQIVRLFNEEQKTFRMMLAWLDKCRDLIHVERLRSFATELSTFELRILGALALKQVKCGDRRFSLIADYARSELQTRPKESESDLETNDQYLISKYGVDEELQEFGLKSSKVDSADQKKLFNLEEIFRRNAWLRFRALIGANFRADLAFIMSHKLATNPYRAAKVLGCSQETAYRLWKGLKMYPSIEKLAT